LRHPLIEFGGDAWCEFWREKRRPCCSS
jgi:hypothetical protein